MYQDVFTGGELIDWLLDVGLIKERSEGVLYGRKLLEGSVIEHVTNKHHFLDMTYFYRSVPAAAFFAFASKRNLLQKTV